MGKRIGKSSKSLKKPIEFESVTIRVLIVPPYAYFHVPESLSCEDVVRIANLNDFSSRGVKHIVIDNTLIS